MNYHRQSRIIVGCLLLVCGLSTAVSYGQLLPPAISSSPDPTPNRPEIDAFVSAQVKKLVDPDPAHWASGRSPLISQASASTDTAGFLDIYADALNAALMPLALNPDARIRLNAAIVTARVAAKAGNGRLRPVTERFLADKSDAVVLWGLQSAKYIMPTLILSLAVPQAEAMAKEVLKAAEGHIGNGAVTEEAYRAMLLDPTLPAAPVAATDFLRSILQNNPKALQAIIPHALELLEFRVKLYDDTSSPPPQPSADVWATQFFVNKVWGNMMPVQQKQSLQLMLLLEKGAAKQNAAAESPEMLDVIKRTATAFDVASVPLKSLKVQTAAQAFGKINKDTKPDEVNAFVANLEDALKEVGVSVAAAP